MQSLANRNVTTIPDYLTFALLTAVLECIRSQSGFTQGGFQIQISGSWESCSLQEEMQMLSLTHKHFISIKPCNTGSGIGCVFLKTDYYFGKGEGN